MDGPDLFVVCKTCQAEVSPYITECPYCGNRLRKRAPKLEKGMAPSPKPRRGPGMPSRSSGSSRPKSPKRPAKPRRDRSFGAERPSWAGARRPYGALFIVVASVLFTLAGRAGLDESDYVFGFGDEPWRAATSVFVYFGTGYELIALAGAFLFAWLLERRHGIWAPLLIFVVCGMGGLLGANAVDPGVVSTGANGGALGLLGAWVTRDILQRRRGEDPETDGLGVVVIAVILILLPVAAEEAHPLAGAFGGVLGLLLGLPLARLSERA